MPVNVKARLGNVKARLGNVKSEAQKHEVQNYEDRNCKAQKHKTPKVFLGGRLSKVFAATFTRPSGAWENSGMPRL